MTPAEENRFKDFDTQIAEDNIRITLRTTDHPQSTEIKAFGKQLAHLLPSATIKTESADDNTSLPALIIGNSLYYHAIPLGPEMEPFLEALKMSVNNSENQVSQLSQKLADLNSPASLEIYIAPQCPYCPKTVRTLIPLSFATRLIQVSIIDTTLFPEIAADRGLRSVPTTFLDESFSWTGAVDLHEIINILENRDPSQLSTESLKKMIHEGLAGKVAEMMVQKGFIFPNFIELLFHHEWPVRLGAMVTMEEIEARDSHLATHIEKPLWDRFFDMEDPVKGDIIYVLGKTGNRETLTRLDSILKGPFGNDVKETAKEAIETIRKRLD